MAKHRDLTGMVFSRLTVIGKYSTGPVKWECKCSCGNPVNVIVETSSLTCNNTRSCGCIHKEWLVARNKSHNMSSLPEYGNWKDMKKRCYNVNNKRFKNYLVKGILVCDEWLEDFSAFYEYIGPKPDDNSESWSVERINNWKGYEPGNVKWLPLRLQSQNRHIIDYDVCGINRVTSTSEFVDAVCIFPRDEIKHKRFFVKDFPNKQEALEVAHEWVKDALWLIDFHKDSGATYGKI